MTAKVPGTHIKTRMTPLPDGSLVLNPTPMTRPAAVDSLGRPAASCVRLDSAYAAHSFGSWYHRSFNALQLDEGGPSSGAGWTETPASLRGSRATGSTAAIRKGEEAPGGAPPPPHGKDGSWRTRARPTPQKETLRPTPPHTVWAFEPGVPAVPR